MPGSARSAHELYLQVLAMAPELRPAFLAALCEGDAVLRTDVEALLASDVTQVANAAKGQADVETGGPVRAPIVSQPLSLVMRESPGAVIGRYKLRELIGEGGMGTVWIADQSEPVRRKVALKLVKPGMDTKEVLSRFEVERQALALMDHPNIAKVHDGGMTDAARPYFVMEYVKGVPMTQYCDQGKLTVEDRLRLFVQVCQAVQHAHQKGIIHRDLKPSNILVCLYDGRPIPKIIDFGLAKAMHQPLTEHTLYTAHGVMVGTPLYMSPEQAEFNNLDVDTRTDIYSLGVILYELLTGTTPLERKQVREAGFEEILRLIKEEDPQKPSTRISGSQTLPTIAAQRGLDPAQLSRKVRGDLDWIVMKALEKDRARRYETANGLARDVQRYLDDEPVEACPPSLGYKLRKLARRNRRAIATTVLVGVVTIVALAVIAGSIGWVVRDRQMQQAAVERRMHSALDEFAAAIRDDRLDEARAALKQAEALAGGIAISPQPDQRLMSAKVDLKLAERLAEIQLDRSGVSSDARGREATAAAYRQAFDEYGLSFEALKPGEAAERIRRSAVRESVLAAVYDWAFALPASESEAASRKPSRADLLAIAAVADDDPWRRRLREGLQAQDVSQLNPLARNTLTRQQRPLTLVLLGMTLWGLGDRSTAQALLQDAAHRDDSEFCINQALGLMALDQSSVTALRYLQLCRAQRPGNWAIRSALGWAYYWGDDGPEAERELREAIRLRPDDVTSHVRLARVLAYRQELGPAIQMFQRAMRLDPADDSPCRELIEMLDEYSLVSEGESIFRAAIEAHPDAAPAHVALGDVLLRLNKRDEAEAVLEMALKLDPSVAEAVSELKAQPGPGESRKSDLQGRIDYYTANITANPDDHASALRLAVIHLYYGRRAKYEALCQTMLARSGEWPSAIAAHRTSLACLLSSPPVGDLERLQGLAVRAADEGGSSPRSRLLYGRGRALAAYRAGRWEETLEWSTRSRLAGHELTVSETVPFQDMVLEAMAHFRLGHTADARRLYDSAAEQIARRFRNAPEELGYEWFDWLVYEILRREAVELLGSTVKDASGETEASTAERTELLALFAQGRWDEGAPRLKTFVESHPADHLLAMQAAAVFLYRDDRPAYEAICQSMLHRYADTEDPTEADRVAKACLLGNPPAAPLPDLNRLAEIAVSDPEHGFYRFFLLARALAAYRSGDWNATLRWTRHGQQRLGDPDELFYLAAHYFLVQSLAEHRLNKPESAAASLAEAESLMQSHYPNAPQNLEGRWADWMIYAVLHQEARALIPK